MKTLLMIGNSFADDAAAHMNQISKMFDEEILVGVLYIGGCPLHRHAENLRDEAKAYEYRENGITLATGVSIQDAVAKRNWDYVSVQQASYLSGRPETFHPHIDELIAYVKAALPKATLILYKTWAYENGYGSETFAEYGYDHDTMLARINSTFEALRKEIRFPVFINGADLIDKALRHYGKSFHRDGFHLNEDGRYLIGTLFCYTLCGKPHGVYLPSEWTYDTPHEMPLAKECIDYQAFVGHFLKAK